MKQPSSRQANVTAGAKTPRSAILGDAPYRAPANALEATIAAAWEDVLGVAPIGRTDDFDALSGHNTWLAYRLMAVMEKALGRRLPVSILVRAPTVATQAELLAKVTDDRELWCPVLEVQRGSTRRLPLYLVPGAAGDVLVIARLGVLLGEDQPFYTFQIPGLDGNSQPVGDVPSLARFLMAELRRQQPQGPYCLGGYSFGAAVAYEMARLLVSQGEEVAALILLDAAAQSPLVRRVWHFVQGCRRWLGLEETGAENLFRRLVRAHYGGAYFFRHGGARAWLGRRYAAWKRRLRALARRGLAAQNGRRVRQQGLWSQFRFDPVRAKLVLNNERAYQTYLPEPYPGRVVLIRSETGHGDPGVRPADRWLGWKVYARGGVDLYELSGGHLDLLRVPQVYRLAEILRGCLDRAMAERRDHALALAEHAPRGVL